MSLADIKANARRAIHGSLAVSCSLTDTDHPGGLLFAEDYTGVGLTVRYHTKIAATGDLEGSYAEVLDGIDRLVFHAENVAAASEALVANGELPISLLRNAQIVIPEYSLLFRLDSLEPPDGPGEIIWNVARVRL